MPNLKIDGDFEGFGLVALEAAYNGALCLAGRCRRDTVCHKEW